jgi:hypothetical protein
MGEPHLTLHATHCHEVTKAPGRFMPLRKVSNPTELSSRLSYRPPAGKIPSRRGADRHEEPPNTRWASERRELERSSSLCFLRWADSLPQDRLSPRGQAEARNLQHVHARGSKRPSRAASSWKRREPPVREEAETAETSSADDISTVEELGDALGIGERRWRDVGRLALGRE